MSLAPLPSVVLDTNVLLDWLVFRDPEVLHIADAVTSGRMRWIATHSMRDELERVLTYAWIVARQPDSLHIASTWERYATVQAAPALRAPMRCGDPDDQKFIDLAVAEGARWLLTKDRELLKLAKRARLKGVAVIRPGEWREMAPAPDASAA